jgi:hypothetical protein
MKLFNTFWESVGGTRIEGTEVSKRNVKEGVKDSKIIVCDISVVDEVAEGQEETLSQISIICYSTPISNTSPINIIITTVHNRKHITT